MVAIKVRLCLLHMDCHYYIYLKYFFQYVTSFVPVCSNIMCMWSCSRHHSMTLMDITDILCSPQLTGRLGDQGITDRYTVCTPYEDISRVLTTQLDRYGQPHLAG